MRTRINAKLLSFAHINFSLNCSTLLAWGAILGDNDFSVSDMSIDIFLKTKTKADTLP